MNANLAYRHFSKLLFFSSLLIKSSVVRLEYISSINLTTNDYENIIPDSNLKTIDS